MLEAGKPLRSAGLTEAEVFTLRSFSFWSIKPELVVVNVAEDNLAFADAFAAEAKLTEPVMGICCKIEAELAGLDAADQKEFLASLGIAEPAFGRIIRGAFSLLGRISFFTSGKDEVKAWVIPEGTKAPKAAGAIHNDFERGFIKAEVMHYDDFIACGSEAQLKQPDACASKGKNILSRTVISLPSGLMSDPDLEKTECQILKVLHNYPFRCPACALQGKSVRNIFEASRLFKPSILF